MELDYVTRPLQEGEVLSDALLYEICTRSPLEDIIDKVVRGVDNNDYLREWSKNGEVDISYTRHNGLIAITLMYPQFGKTADCHVQIVAMLDQANAERVKEGIRSKTLQDVAAPIGVMSIHYKNGEFITMRYETRFQEDTYLVADTFVDGFKMFLEECESDRKKFMTQFMEALMPKSKDNS